MVFRESETVELKSIVVEDIKKEIIAFANCEGGKLYIGVQDDGTVVGLDDPDGVALQISNMVRDAIKPDVTMFLRYKTIEEQGKKLVVVDIQQGTERPYYIAKKGLRPEGVYVRQGYSSVPATNTMIRRMIKETDGDHFEDLRSLEQNLTFQAAKKEFEQCKVPFGVPQMKTLGIMNQEGIYTNLGLLLSDQCVHTIKAAVFEGTTQNEFKDRREFSGSLFEQMNEAYDYIDFRNQNHSTFLKLHRIDRRDYPEAAVREAGAEEIYADAFTGTKKHRPQLDKLLKVIQNGDKVVVTKLDRIARSATQGIALIDMMLDKGVTVHILNMGIMDNTPTGRLIRTIMLAFAEFERDMIVERTQEGKAIAKQKDDFKEGRPRISKIKIDHALSLLNEGYSYKQVERMTGISTATLARRKRERLLEEDS